MSWMHALRERLRPLFGRERLEAEMDEELAFHFQREVERNVAAGMGRREARRAARARMGGAIRPRESVRSLWRGIELGGLGQEARLAFRRLARRPAFSLTAVVTLGLGIGATTAIFSLVRGVLVRPLPYPDPDRLVMIWGNDLDGETWLSARELLEYERATTSFERLGGYLTSEVNLTEDAEAERVPVARVTADALALLGAGAIEGRVFTRREDVPGADAVALLSYELWQRRYGGDPGVIGRELTANGQRRTIVGVLEREFRLPADFRRARPVELLVPAGIDRSAELAWGDRSYHLVGRLAPGVTAGAATGDIRAAVRAWEEAGHVENVGGIMDRDAVPLDEFLLSELRAPLSLLMGAVAFMLLISCVNVAHLLLARAESRRGEVAVAAALGAGRVRMARQLLLESGVLASAGAVLGVGLAVLGTRATVALAPIQAIRLRGVEIDAAVLAFAALVTLATTLLAGVVPAFQVARVDVARALGGARGSARGRDRQGVRRALLVAETALSLVLVVGAALLARSFMELRRIDLGFEPDEVLVFDISPSSASYQDAARVGELYRTLLDRLGGLPGVESTAAARVVPLRRTIGTWSITIEDREPGPGELFEPSWQIVTPGYFETLGLELVEGRVLLDTDHADAPPVVVISEAMANRYWSGENAIGRRFHLGTLDQPWMEVVGVVRAPHHNAVVEDPRAEMYVPHAQWPVARGDGVPQWGMSILIRADGDPMSVLPAARRVIGEIDGSLPISQPRRLTDVVDDAVAEPRFTTLLLGLFAALALVLAAIGLYGVTSYAVSRRTNEMGIRLALGAERRDVTRLVVGEVFVVAALGVGLGLLSATWLTRFVSAQLYGVSRLDPLTFALVPAVLLAVAALAAWLPARRAGRISPVTALRTE